MKINSEIIFEASGFLIKLIMLISIMIFIQGHNFPGGGFIGGLTFICGYILIKINRHKTYLIENKVVRKTMLLIGLAFLMLALGVPVLLSKPLMTGVWKEISIFGDKLKIGSPLVFDGGIYLIVSTSISFIVDVMEAEWF